VARKVNKPSSRVILLWRGLRTWSGYYSSMADGRTSVCASFFNISSTRTLRLLSAMSGTPSSAASQLR